MGVDTNPNEVLRITHDAFDSEPGEVTRHQFEVVWEPLGWKIVDADDSAVPSNEGVPVPHGQTPEVVKPGGGSKPTDTKEGDR